MVRSRAAAVRVAMLVALVACQAKKPKQDEAKTPPSAVDEPAADAPVTQLPPATPTEPIGVAGPVKLVAADDAGVWQVLCAGDEYVDQRLRVVIGGGPGFEARELVATTPHDLVVRTDTQSMHVDVVARTTRPLGRMSDAAVDATSRRVVVATGKELVVRDPGKPARRVQASGEVAAIELHTARWAEVWYGAPPSGSSACYDARFGYHSGASALVDLDPAGVEAVEDVGPQIGITPTGEITLRGEVVLGTDCVGTVIAALADPPRVLATCRDGDVWLGQPGTPAKRIGSTSGTGAVASSISENLTLGQRLHCLWGGCADLIDGGWYETYSNTVVISTGTRLVRKAPEGLLVDALDTHEQTSIVLPQIAQAVTVDTVTGRRKVGAPPPAALEAIDVAGEYLLYGRFVVDVAGAKVTRTLDADAVAIDRTGRALVPAAPGQGPLRWVGP